MAFKLEMKLKTQPYQIHKLETYFRCAEKMYNKTAYYANTQLSKLKKDYNYQKYLNLYLTTTDKTLKKDYHKQLKETQLYYGLSESQLQQYINVQRKRSYQDTLDSTSVQNLASRVWKGIEHILYSKGKQLHYKRKGSLNTIECKRNTSGLRYDKEQQILSYKKLKFPVLIRENDIYAKEAIEENDICYCAIRKRPFQSGYQYFLQLTLKGIPPLKNRELRIGVVGIDIGTSTIACIGEKEGFFKPLAPNINTYNKEIIYYQQKLDNSRRISNPTNYNEDGTIKRGYKRWIQTNNYKRNYFKLKNLYRKRSVYVKQTHNEYVNQILTLGNEFIIEPMDFKGLQKKSTKPTTLSKKIMVTKEMKTIYKCHKKKRYGKSLNNHAPSTLVTLLKQKLSYYKEEIYEVDKYKYRASQYNHDRDECMKMKLSDRWKLIQRKEVQRDLYAAFLLKNKKDKITIDRDKCINEFEDFLKIQETLINKLKHYTNLPSCMGI